MPRQKESERLIRGFLVDNDKMFHTLDSNGRLRGKFNFISYREKSATDENEFDTYVQKMSNLKLKKKRSYNKKESDTSN